MILSHKIRLVPTASQERYFRQACGVSRFTYNWGLARWKEVYESGGKPSGHTLKKEFNALRGSEFPWTYEVHRDCTSGAFSNLQKAFQGFFRRVKQGSQPGYPKFKSKHFSKDSFPVANDKFRVEGRRIKLPKIGWVKLREFLRFTGKIMSAVVGRQADQWHVSIAVDTQIPRLPPRTKEAVGIDLGVSTLATLSDRRKIEHSKRMDRLSQRIRYLQRSVSRKQKGSNNRRKAVRRLARKHYRLFCLRADTLHKLTTSLIQDYETIVIEDLRVSNMVKNRRLVRRISDQGWYEIRRQLEYKSKLHGRNLVLADRFYPSTKTCSTCGHKKDMGLSERTYRCQRCGLQMDRDLNAALNLRKLGAGSSEVTPVEKEALAGGPSVSGETAFSEAGTGKHGHGQLCLTI